MTAPIVGSGQTPASGDRPPTETRPGRPAHEPTFAGTPPFPEAARTALADTQLRANLGRATATIRTKRANVVAERADWEELRLAGAAIKDNVMRDLPALLDQLERAVTAAGGVVHWARDAAEANAIVAGIAGDAGATEVVKVKSMATQEIELNEALRQAGIEVWETDLAEMIVQLGNDLPSHILVPAIHRNRSEIRDIFREEMGKVGRPAPDGLTDEPGELAEAARLHLREKFLRARVAISGANFGIAETGTIAVVESEGNGRMCLTLPDVLITVMGIEKLLPTWRDLEVFLQLLPRSSTAERMNPYTSLVDGRHAGRRAAGLPPHPARQRPHRCALGHGRPAGAALHPLLGLPERLPRLRADRWSSLRVAVSGPHRRHHHAAAARHRQASRRQADRLAALRFVALRRLLRGLPGAHRHPGGARPSARRGHPTLPSDAPCADRRVRRVQLGGIRDADAWPAGSRRAGRRPGRSDIRSPRDASAYPGSGAGRRLVRWSGPQGAGARVLPGLVAADRWREHRPMSDARQVILDRIAAALQDRPDLVPVPRAYERALPPGTDIAELFVERVSDYRATVTRTTATGLPVAIAAVLANRGARRLAVPAGIPDAWLAEADVERIGDEPPLSHRDLDALDGVVTGCAVAIAETGTIVLDAGPDQGRRAISLLPDLHVCVVFAEQVVGSVPEALERLIPTRPQTWISGPSATSDIELQRVEGVHGPRILDVIFVEG